MYIATQQCLLSLTITISISIIIMIITLILKLIYSYQKKQYYDSTMMECVLFCFLSGLFCLPLLTLRFL
jgi:uncharacterized membrane protein (DUF485 family)